MTERWLGLAAALALTATGGPAQAEWHEARTDHFRVYIDADEALARDYAERLERYDAALRLLYDAPDDPATHANPVRIFVLDNSLFLRVCQCSTLVGYYAPRAGGSAIFSVFDPRFDRKAKQGSMTSTVVLLHEYAHHFMYSNEPIAYPFWFSEGFAEFNANVDFEQDGSIVIGLPANYRASLIQSDISFLSLPMNDFFASTSASPVAYSRGWLLTHYLMLNPDRQGQLGKYLKLMNQGKSSLDAAADAFGDVRALWREMFAYSRGKLFPPLRVPPPARPVQLALTRLSPGLAEMMPLWARLVNGAKGGLARELARDMAKIAAAYPDDVEVQTRYADAELAAGHPELAEAAADRALALTPQSLPALLVRGKAEIQRLTVAKSSDAAAWSAARGWLLKANRLDPDAAEPLIAYFKSFAAAGAAPTDGAVKGLRRAHVLAPEDGAVRLLLARHLLDGDAASEARALLQPIAFAPHRRNGSRASEVLGLIDAGKLDEARALMAKLVGDGDND